MKECLQCLRSLGRFHALSLALKHQQPETFRTIVDTVQETYYSASLESWYRNFMQRLVAISKDALEIESTTNADEFPAEFKAAVLSFLESNIYQAMVDLTHARNQNSLITHGDCWLPNFLLRSDSVRLVDFQMVRYGSPALDIILFVYTCTDRTMRLEGYEQLLTAYYQSCSELLLDLGTDPQAVFPRTELTRELERFGRFGCGIAVESIPLSLLDETEVPDLDKIEGTEALPLEQVMTVRNIKTSAGRRRLLDVFRHAYDCGYLQ
uniref:CHK domain-containing protein n=1 Tax=Anopheles atroparvus TaxID=41427 RepID=A0A182J9J4_ANOAO